MRSRNNFFYLHLSLSLLFILIILIWVFFYWYPSPLAQAVGVTHIFLMMLAIDVIVGPLLGFIVYKEGKKTLKFDLAVIILIQFAALCYGVYSIGQGRPVWIVYNVDRFELVRNNEIIDQNIQKAKPEYRHPSWFKPQYVAIQLASDIKTRNDDMFTEALGGISLAQKPERYVALSKVKQQIQQRVQNLNELNQFNDQQDVDKILKQYPDANSWVPLKASAVDMVVLMDKEKAQVVKIVDLRPWK
ncbi:type IV pilin accessory protein [Acinetobacter ursingii]|uniref:TfpX/TfpZ family type IV pilin accessory protein n=1 Tax=Acinetobacter ursingii TaxID=108980 RepID=UPI00244C800A|nr:TfpX/TfpZ family type IV pilin accessory protein [Acinetobacter ursingii]MDG9858811.1 type IV pilin accessory protein [Acinetobacter ursingii]MDG9892498.1 type IV pilin accessory protein [Acinetobacter ursingii]MDH0006211.1 type IV pilin accessory protein [Acinetobacter ursingii]MDH0477749.1 type IV pilin accessory protein [Acinetobacter ursingii]MDH2118588.1 type IV pilin accessory protein [Acinetobacter ursingii]